MKAEEFPSVSEQIALRLWRNHLAWHIEHWDDEVRGAAKPLPSVVSIGPGVEWRPVNLDRPAGGLPPGRLSLGHDPELISEHLQTQSAIHSEVVNRAVIEWGEIWRYPTRKVRPRLEGEADSDFWLRVMFARDAISGILSGQPLPFGLANGRPDFTDQGGSLKWFLIDLWNAIGSYWLQMWAERLRATMRFKIQSRR